MLQRDKNNEAVFNKCKKKNDVSRLGNLSISLKGVPWVTNQKWGPTAQEICQGTEKQPREYEKLGMRKFGT